jgi:cation diffusion facilitator family transporter
MVAVRVWKGYTFGQPMAPRPRPQLTQRYVIFAGLIGNFFVAATKLAAAAFTGSSAMLSEGVHSVVDSCNSILLLYGLHRSAALPDHAHPLGYGREIYFWSFVVAVLVFALGAGVSFYEGVSHILNPEPISNASVNYVVLALSAIFDGATWWLALRHFKGATRYPKLLQAVRDSKDPPAFMVLFEDSAALIGLAIAAAGTYLSVLYDAPVLDGVASILISLVLAFSAAVLARETKGLLIGEAADPDIVAAMMQIAKDMDGIANANGIMTIHLAPAQIAVSLSLEFSDDLRTPDIETKVAELEDRIRKLHPEVVAVFVKPQSSMGFKEAMIRKYGQSVRSVR